MYKCYQVVLVGEDGVYPQSEWQTWDAAVDEAIKLESDAGEGQRYVVKEFNRGF